MAGPVTVSLLARHTSAVLRSVRDEERTIPISRRGAVVAVLRPLSARDRFLTFGDTELPEISARELGRDNTAGFVARAAAGEQLLVTYRNRTIALLSPLSAWKAFNEFEAQSAHLGDPANGLTDVGVYEDVLPRAVEMSRAYRYLLKTREVTRQDPTTASST
jgi:antitoxin (DNA-binding transcriptional repressor) of toxin-antitoxin stability system